MTFCDFWNILTFALIPFVKYITIVFCSTYSTIKLLNIKRTFLLKEKVYFFSFTFINAFFVCILRQYTPAISILVMVSISVFVHMFFYNISISNAVTTTIISYGISYLSYSIGVVSVIILSAIADDRFTTINITNTLIIALVQITLNVALFCIKRLRHGIPFLVSTGYWDIGIYLCISVLMAVSFLGMQPKNNNTVIILAYTLLVCGIVLWFWWKNRIKQEYMEQMRKKEQKELQDTITSLNEKVATLLHENEEFSKIIHKDNKLIPAMELAVRELLYSVAHCDSREIRIAQTDKMLKQCVAISKERAGIVSNYEHPNKTLPTTDIPILDALFSFMLQKSTGQNILFDLKIYGSVKEMTISLISEQDASTILADLIENAIFSVGDNVPNGCILVELGRQNKYSCISVSDNGTPFPEKVIQNWGVQCITTRTDNGGKGIGLMSTYEICKRYCASFHIEYFEPNALYTKRVSICFDKSGEFVVKDNRGQFYS